MRNIGAATLALLAFAAFTQGQEGPPPGLPGPPGEGRPREEAAKMVDAYIISNLQEGLALTDEQFVKLLPLVKRLQTDRREYAMKRMRTMREMRQLLQAGGASETRVLELLKQVKAMEAEQPAAMHRDLEAIDAVLAPLQQAKFRVLEMEVEVKIREIMGQIRGEGARPGFRRGQRTPPAGEPPPP